MEPTELMPLLRASNQAILDKARGSFFLPENEDPIARLFYLATFDQPTGKFPLCRHQVECYASRLSEPATELNLRVLCVTALIASICAAFLVKLALSHQNSPWASVPLGCICAGSVLAGYCFRYKERSLAKEVSAQFTALSHCLRGLKSSDEKKAKFLADRIKIKKIDEKLKVAKVDAMLRVRICEELRQAKRYVRGKLQLEALVV